jgi:glycosyltransferase involved in cell wall biosynthesis
MGPCHESDLSQEMARLVPDAGLQSKVDLLGNLSFQDAQDRVARADIGLCLLHPTPNYLNSLATKILEYMAMGLAVVASDFECWRPYVQGTGGGVQVNPLDPQKVAAELETLIRQPQEIRRMGRLGQKAVLPHYLWDQEKLKLLAFYQSLLVGRG